MSTDTCVPSGRRYRPSWWGNAFWRTLHLGSLNYIANDANKRAWKSLLLVWLPSALPCAKCRKHYLARLRNFNFKRILKTRRSLVIFLHKLHNDIGEDIAKKKGEKFKPLSFKAFCTMYKSKQV